jgi:TonB family protein
MPAAPRSLRLCTLSTLLCIFSLLPTLQAQSTEADIKAKLMDKPLYLRGFWRENNLHFDSSGQLQGKSDNITFTLGGFELQSVKLKPDKLILEGHRIGLELADNKQKRVRLQNSIHIEIAANPAGDYGTALDAIFVDGLPDLAPLLPAYWQDYAQRNFLLATPTSRPTQQQWPPKRVASKLTPPKLLRSAEPNLNQEARNLKYGGPVIVNLWIEPDGSITHLTVRQAVGMGLDESALAAVQHYVFSPAKDNGTPVRVELNVFVNFQIF